MIYLGVYYKYYKMIMRNSTRNELFAHLYNFIFRYIFRYARLVLKVKNPVVLKFDVWDESSDLHWNVRQLTKIIADVFKPKSIFYVDIEKKLIKKAVDLLKRNNVNGYFTNGDISNLPFKHDSFDLVIDFSTTDHLYDKEFVKTIKRVYEVLKHDGVYIIYHLNKDYLGIKEWNELYSSGTIPSIPRSLDEIEKTLLGNNFKIIYKSFLWSFIFDVRLFWNYFFRRHKIIFKMLPDIVKYTFFGMRDLNMFFVIIAKKE